MKYTDIKKLKGQYLYDNRKDKLLLVRDAYISNDNYYVMVSAEALCIKPTFLRYKEEQITIGKWNIPKMIQHYGEDFAMQSYDNCFYNLDFGYEVLDKADALKYYESVKESIDKQFNF